MSRRRYKFDIYARGVVSTTGTISWTFGENRFPDGYLPTVGGQIVRPTQGAVESQPWTVSLLDVASSFTGLLGDSSGRLQQIGRLTRMRASLDSTASTAYTTLAVGRLTDIGLNPSVAAYDLTVSDERWVEQQETVFTKIDDSVSLIPGGLVKNAPASWIDVPDGLAQWQVVLKYGRTAFLTYTDSRPLSAMAQPVGDFILQDIKPGTNAAGMNATTSFIAGLTTGFFRHLRFRVPASSADYSIAAFGYDARVTAPFFRFPQNIVSAVQNGWTSTGHAHGVWVVYNSTAAAPAVGSKVYGYVHGGGTDPTGTTAVVPWQALRRLPASRAVPFLVGGANGLHPGTVARLAYQNTYGASTSSARIRISTAAFDAWEADPSYGRCWIRATAPQALADFLQRTIYQPYGMVPAIDSSGRIAPKSILAPTTNDTGTVANALRLTSTNLVAPHPTWGSQSREMANVLEMAEDHITRAGVVGILYTPNLRGPFDSADKLIGTTASITRNYVNTTQVGRRTLRLRYPMVAGFNMFSSGLPFLWADFSAFTSKFARQFFSRFGDGPIYTDVQALPSIDQTSRGRIQVGQYVAVKLGTYPNIGTNARGSTRLMQVVGRVDGPLAIRLTLLDAGAAANPLSSPATAVARSSQSTRHGLKVTISGLTAGASYETQAGHSSTGSTSAPATDSSVWQTILVGTSVNLTQHYLRLASNTKWWARSRAVAPGRIMSGWGSMDSTITAKITGPSSFQSTGLSGGSVGLKWKYGSSVYGVDVMVTNSTSQSLGSSLTVQRLAPLSTRTVVNGLDLGVTHKFGVRHFDAYGGFSTAPSLTLTPSTVSVAAPNMKGLSIVFGSP